MTRSSVRRRSWRWRPAVLVRRWEYPLEPGRCIPINRLVFAKRDTCPVPSADDGHRRDSRNARSACKASITARIWGGAERAASRTA